MIPFVEIDWTSLAILAGVILIMFILYIVLSKIIKK